MSASRRCFVTGIGETPSNSLGDCSRWSTGGRELPPADQCCIGEIKSYGEVCGPGNIHWCYLIFWFMCYLLCYPFSWHSHGQNQHDCEYLRILYHDILLHVVVIKKVVTNILTLVDIVILKRGYGCGNNHL